MKIKIQFFYDQEKNVINSFAFGKKNDSINVNVANVMAN